MRFLSIDHMDVAEVVDVADIAGRLFVGVLLVMDGDEDDQEGM